MLASTTALVLEQLSQFKDQALLVFTAAIAITMGIFVYYWAKRHALKSTHGK